MNHAKQQVIYFNSGTTWDERILAIRTKLAFTRLRRELREKQRLINAKRGKQA